MINFTKVEVSKKIWYNYWMPKFKSDEPNFYDPNKFDWALEAQQLYPQLKKELNNILNQRKGRLIPYYSEAVNTDKNSWTTLGFKTWDIEVKDNLSKSPTISKFLSNNPNIVSASMNLLNPNSKLDKHQGDTNAIFRCHLGINIKASLPEMGFCVAGENKNWKEGELLIFTDAKEHHAWNNSETQRLIFLFDVIKPEFINKKKRICLNIRAFLLIQWIGNKFKLFLKFPKIIHRITHLKICLFLWIILPYQRKKGVILNHS